MRARWGVSDRPITAVTDLAGLSSRLSVTDSPSRRPASSAAQTPLQLRFRRVASGLDPGAAAGVQKDRPRHISGLLGAQHGVKSAAQGTGQQNGLVALRQKRPGRPPRQDDPRPGQGKPFSFPQQRKHPVDKPGRDPGRQLRRHVLRLTAQPVRYRAPHAQIAQGFLHVQHCRAPPFRTLSVAKKPAFVRRKTGRSSALLLL